MQNRAGPIDRRVLYAQAIFGEPEKRAVLASLDNQFLASGPAVAAFEGKVAALFGKRHAVAVNSGSSANLLALAASGLRPGGEIVTPACTFATTAAPIVQLGFVPVFVDCDIGRYTMRAELVEAAVTPRTVAIMAPQLGGGVCDMAGLRRTADRHGLLLVDDSCDTFAPQIGGRPVAAYSDVTTTSFYGSHIITAMGTGGMLLTDDGELARRAAAQRDWGRAGDDDESFERRFSCRLGGVPYDAKFVYEELGYNFRMAEAAAAFGLAQLDRLADFQARRRANFDRLLGYFRRYEHWFHLPEVRAGVSTTWIAFPLTLRAGCPFSRCRLLRHLESAGVQTRVFFSGNITRHPAFASCRLRVHGTLGNADRIMEGGFLVGCHPALGEEDLDYLIGTFERFMVAAA